MTLLENSFAILGVSPRDDRRTLSEKADEAALLGGADTEEALAQLMQLNRRIPAELSYLPGATAEAAEAFVTYARQREESQSAELPPVDDLGTALAQANALQAFFARWPGAEDPAYFQGLCLSLDSILRAVTLEETLTAINADRAAGQWEKIADEQALREPLDERLRALCAPVTAAMNAMDREAATDALNVLMKKSGFDTQGVVAQAACDALYARVHEEAERLRQDILEQTEQFRTSGCTESALDKLMDKTRHWCSLTLPLRRTPGEANRDAKKMGHAVRNVLVDFINKAPTIEKKKLFQFPVFNGTRVVTVTYQSKMEAIRKAREQSRLLRDSFPEQEQLVQQLTQDLETLNQMIRNEEEMLRKTETEARLRAYGR